MLGLAMLAAHVSEFQDVSGLVVLLHGELNGYILGKSNPRLAGVAVDVPLHPLDTLKTRMQSTDGCLGCCFTVPRCPFTKPVLVCQCKYLNLRFWASGGYRNLWSGQLVLQLILDRS